MQNIFYQIPSSSCQFLKTQHPLKFSFSMPWSSSRRYKTSKTADNSPSTPSCPFPLQPRRCPFPKFWGTSAPFVNNNQNSGWVSRPNKSQNFGRSGRVAEGYHTQPFTPRTSAAIEAALWGCSSPNGSYFFGAAFRRLTTCRTWSNESARDARSRVVFFSLFLFHR